MLADLREHLARGLIEAIERAEAREDAADVTLPGGRALHADDDMPDVAREVRRIARGWLARWSPNKLERIGKRIATATNEHQRREWGRLAAQEIGVDPTRSEPWLAPALEAFMHENVQLITKLQQTTLADIEATVLREVVAGSRHEQIAKDLTKRLGVAESKAKLIARDQTLSLLATLNKQRQTNLGVERYIWRTVRDGRVRLEHEERDGQVFRWDQPPPGGHPGTEVNCRCYAEPIFDDEESAPPAQATEPAPAPAAPRPAREPRRTRQQPGATPTPRPSPRTRVRQALPEPLPADEPVLVRTGRQGVGSPVQPPLGATWPPPEPRPPLPPPPQQQQRPSTREKTSAPRRTPHRARTRPPAPDPRDEPVIVQQGRQRTGSPVTPPKGRTR